MRRILPSQPASPMVRRLLWWLIAALLFGQSFSALHRIVHAPGRQPAQPTAIQAVNATEPALGESSLSHWFGVHSARDCALVDHALHPTPPAAPVLLPAPAIIAALPSLPLLASIVPNGRRASFEARAPPPLTC